MTADKIQKRISDCVTLFGFEYDGKSGGVDPYYLPETNSFEFLLFYDGDDVTVHSIDDVMNTPFINGKSLLDLFDKLTITDW